jgi:hypothetical protein
MEKKRLKYKQNQSKYQPNQCHQMKPPELQMKVSLPGIVKNHHVKSGYASDERRHLGLNAKPALQFFEELNPIVQVVNSPE